MSNWPYFLAVIAVISIVLIWFIVKRSRHAKGAEVKQKRLSSSILSKAWRDFLKEIPGNFRRSIMLYQHFIVIGEAGAGKRQLIDKCTDWQGQSCQFYPSYTVNPMLKMYLGSKVLVQEIPSALLSDTSKQARSAFIKLWKPLFRKKEPTVVVVLNAGNLQSSSPELIKRQAQMMRGKINILSRIRKEPVKVCINLTFMEFLPGYLEFSTFLQDNNIPLNLAFDKKESLKNIESCLYVYEEYLPHALTSIPAKDYLAIIAFFRKAPEILKVLSVFIRILQNPDPLSFEPQIVRLCLTSEKEGDSVSNPFTSTISSQEFDSLSYLTKHRFIAAIILIIALLYLSWGYFYERHFFNKAYYQLYLVEQSPPVSYSEEMHELFLDFSISLEKDPLLAFLPNYFPDTTQKFHKRLINNLRKFYLLPELKSLKHEKNAREKTVYLLALIYASNNNELGVLILKNVDKWTRNLEISENLVKDYIKFNSVSWKNTINLDNLVKRGSVTPANDVQPWMLFFHEVKKVYSKPFITKSYLKEIQFKADRLLKVIEQASRYDLSMKVCELLKKESPIGIETEWIEKSGRLRLDQSSIREFLLFLKGRNISYPLTEGLTLRQCLDNVKTMLALIDKKERRFRFYIDSKKFTFSSKKFNHLIDYSKITFFLRDFISENKRHDGLLFFRDEKDFEDIEMNSGNKGLFFFTGKGKVDGRFTKRAFEQEVKTVLLELPEFLKNLPIKEEYKKEFSDFVFKEVDAYAERYVYEFKNYYKQFGLKASSLGELRFVLNQINLPSSQFQDFLHLVRNNTDLESEDVIYFAPLTTKLKTFDFLKRLMQERKGALPELRKYKDILGQLRGDLEDRKPVVIKKRDKVAVIGDDSTELKRLLSPLGGISLAIFRDEKDSYLNLVRMWLENVGISDKWQQEPFLSPIYEAYSTGVSEVEGVVEKVWDKLWDSSISPVLTKFPFDENAESEISHEELKSLIGPDGDFQKTFREVLSPVCERTSLKWQERLPRIGVFHYPYSMFKMANDLENIAKVLWDKEGKNNKIMLQVEPLLLPLRKVGSPTVLLSYLRINGSSIFGFNQRPGWQDFPLRWWENGSATVGVEIKSDNTLTKSYREISVQKTAWSFYRLLKKARTEDENVFAWTIVSDKRKGKDDITIRFSTKNNPWRLFQLNK